MAKNAGRVTNLTRGTFLLVYGPGRPARKNPASVVNRVGGWRVKLPGGCHGDEPSPLFPGLVRGKTFHPCSRALRGGAAVAHHGDQEAGTGIRRLTVRPPAGRADRARVPGPTLPAGHRLECRDRDVAGAKLRLHDGTGGRGQWRRHALPGRRHAGERGAGPAGSRRHQVDADRARRAQSHFGHGMSRAARPRRCPPTVENSAMTGRARPVLAGPLSASIESASGLAVCACWHFPIAKPVSTFPENALVSRLRTVLPA